MTEGSFSAKKKERVAMKKRYQINQQRAVQEFRQLAREENPHLQMMFPMTEVVGLLQEGVGHLMREAGLALMSLVMEVEKPYRGFEFLSLRHLTFVPAITSITYGNSHSASMRCELVPVDVP